MKWNNILWELPQTILGFIVSKIFTIESTEYFNERKLMIFKKDKWFSKKSAGVSLGYFILLPSTSCKITHKQHEYGHCMQSKKSGWLYLLIFGLPSLTNNLWDRLMHKKWSRERREKWYYSRFPEKQADLLGGVIR